MTTIREAAQRVVWEHEEGHLGWPLQEAITALRAALAEPECPHCAPRPFNPNPESELHGY